MTGDHSSSLESCSYCGLTKRCYRKVCWHCARTEKFEERFWRNVEKTDSCWLWVGSGHASTGYGEIVYRNFAESTHRASWLIHFGEIPGNLCVLHKCDVTLCVRPDHLFLGTHLDNARDRDRKGRDADRFGQHNGMATMTDEKVAEMRFRYASGERQGDLMRAFGISRANVCMIVNRKAWTHLP